MLSGTLETVARTARALRVGEDMQRLGRLVRRTLRDDLEVPLPAGPPGPGSPLLGELLHAPDRDLDVALGAALIAHEDAPEDVDLGRVLAEVDDLAAALRGRLEAVSRDDPAARLALTNRFFFEEQGFSASPSRGARGSGERLADLLLPWVLRRRRGHCVGLSTAYLAIGARAGLPLFGVSAPGHFFVRWDGEGHRQNVETTARGLAHPDEYYVQRFRIAPPLVDRGVYLQNLRRRELLVEVLNNRANFYWDRGDEEHAARDLDRVVQVSHNFARAYVGRGFMALVRGDLSAAQRELTRALEIDPDLARAHLLLGEVHLRAGRLTDAELALERAAGDEQNALALTGHGRLCLRRGQVEEAIRWHESALRTDPACHVAWNNLGVARQAKGDVAGARSAFRRALALLPGFLPARENLLLLGRQGQGLSLLARPRAASIRRSYEQRLRRSPADDELRASYVRFLLETSPDPERALAVAREGEASRPTVKNLESLAQALGRCGRRTEALTALERALGVDAAAGGLEGPRLKRARERLAQ